MKAWTLFFLTFGLCSSAINASARELTKEDANNLIANMGDGTELIIPAEYTEFQFGAFRGCEKIHSVKFLGKAEIISREMFSKCVNLHTVSLPEGVEIIHPEAFCECKSLKNINFPVSVRYIGEGAFYQTALEEITLLNIDTIDKGAFMYCDQLKFITLPYTVAKIASSAFITSGNATLKMGRRYFHILGCGNDQAKKDRVYETLGRGGLEPDFFDSELARQHYDLEDKVYNLQYELNMSHNALASPIANKPRKEALVNAIRKKAQKMDDKAAELARNAAAYRDMLD